MKAANVRLIQEADKSFIFYKESHRFTPWHQHPEYELCLITKGKGIRMVGDCINRFEDNDLVFIGSNTPHTCLCDPEYSLENFKGEGIVIQFVHDFLGDKFLQIHENSSLKKFLLKSSRGYAFFGATKEKIISILMKMQDMSHAERYYSLISIFKIFSDTNEFEVLSSPIFNEPFMLDSSAPMQKALIYILQNFQTEIKIKDLLKITNMSYTCFYLSFKETFQMSFKDYLENIRVGYACKLLTVDSQNISGVAYESGFGNISNFNRQFKKIKNITPTQFYNQTKKIEIDNDRVEGCEDL